MTPVVGQLLLLNLLGLLAAQAQPQLANSLVFVPALVLTRPWTLITYQFLHAGFGHLFFNMLALFFFGPRLEARMGGRSFLGMYLFSGVVGAIVHVLFLLTPLSDGGLMVPMVGASGAVYGVLIAYASFWPRDKILLWFVVPVEVRVLVIGFTLMSLWFGLGGVQGGVAHFAHLGGFLGGWLYLKWRRVRSPAKQFKKKTESPGTRMNERALSERWSRIDPTTLHPVNREEYDRISQKVRALGWPSLTDRERTFVERFGGR